MFKIKFRLEKILFSNLYSVNILKNVAIGNKGHTDLINLYISQDPYNINNDKKQFGYGLEGEWIKNIDYFDWESNYKNIFSWLDQLTVNYSGKLRYGQKKYDADSHKFHIKVIENISSGKRNGKLLKFQNDKVLYSYHYLNNKLDGKNFVMTNFVEIAESILQYVDDECNYRIKHYFNYNMIEYTYYDKNELKYIKRVILGENNKVRKVVWLKDMFYSNYCKLEPYKKITFNKNGKVLCKFKDKLKIEFLIYKNFRYKMIKLNPYV